MGRRDDDPKSRQRRRLIARDAARLLAETGGDDVLWARHKAAARHGVRDESALPGGDEILAALREHRELFGGGGGGEQVLRRQREAAIEAMHHFADFEPRLVGPVLAGDAGDDSPVRLHLHADDPDAVARRLLERGVPARQTSRSVRLTRERSVDVPAWSFDAGGVGFELLQLPLSALRQPPRDPLEERPLERASIGAVRRLLEHDPG